MSVYLIAFANSNDYVVQSGSNAAYADSREGTGTISSVTATSTAQVGQTFNGNYFDFQVFLEFDLSSWPSTLPAFELSLNQQTAPTSAGDTLEVWEYAWSGTGTGNFRAGSVLGSLTAFGSVAFPGSTGTFSVTSATTTISPGAYKLVLASQRQRLNTAPSAAERGIINTADAAGTTSDPYIKAILGTTPLWEWVGISNVAEVTTTAHALTEPAGVAQGDLLVAVISSRIASTTAITLPSGGEWTLVTEQKNSNTATTTSATPSGMMAYCVRGASAPNLTFTHPIAPSVALGRIVAYRNVDTSSPKDTQTSFTTATNVTAVSGTGLTTTQDDDLIVAAACGGQEASWTAFAAATDPTTSSGTGSGATADPAPNTWQERADSNTTTGADTSLAIFDAVKTAAGVTGNLTATASQGAAQVVVAGAFKLVASGGGGVSANPTTVSGTAAAGTPTVSGKASTNVTGVSASGSAGTPTVALNLNVPVTGVAATASAGTPTVSAKANVPLTGVEATGTAGTPTVTGVAIVPITGVEATAAAGDVTVSFGTNAIVTGVAATAAADTPTVIGTAIVPVTGTSATAAAGIPTVSAKASTDVTGVSATASPGVLTATAAAVASLTGVSVSGSAGTVTVSGQSSTSVVGTSASGSVGALAASGKAEVSLSGVEVAGEAGDVSASTVGGVEVALVGVEANASAGAVSVALGDESEVPVAVVGSYRRPARVPSLVFGFGEGVFPKFAASGHGEHKREGSGNGRLSSFVAYGAGRFGYEGRADAAFVFDAASNGSVDLVARGFGELVFMAKSQGVQMRSGHADASMGIVAGGYGNHDPDEPAIIALLRAA